METEIEAFVSEWMRRNSHVFEEVVLLQGDDVATPYGAALHTYLQVSCGVDDRPNKAADGALRNSPARFD